MASESGMCCRVLLLFVAFQRYFSGGLSAGAVK
jgi:ABC-type glycerol-3-phosphate transport system permease component